jgi:hypothetical protein
MAQDDDDVVYTTEDEAAAVVKKPVVKMPTYPTMEVKGICVDAVSKQPLPGVLIQALGDAKYTDMFALVRDGDEWKIVAKVYHVR